MLSNHSSGVARKKMLVLFGVLLAVNAGVAHIVTNQIATAADSLNQVKDDQVIVEEADSLQESDSSEIESKEDAPRITIYTVKSGDTVSSIAQKFGIKQNTLLWANEMTAKSTLKVGQSLVVLSINGIQYTVVKGDTISGIAKKFDADAKEILYFNDLEDATAIQPGFELIIPDAEPRVAPAPKQVSKVAAKPKTTPQPKTETKLPASAFGETDTHDHEKDEKNETEKNDDTADTTSNRYGQFVVPAPGSILTQGYHAVNAVDFGGKSGSTIRAAAKGTVIVAKGGCSLDGSMRNNCNGGFGNFIVVSHDNGVQTLYAHLSKITVSVGDSVDQGEMIGGMGDSGRSTGTHLHFETHGIKNPFTKDKKGTKY